MNQKSELVKVFPKYAILLALLYGVQSLLQYGISYYEITQSLKFYGLHWTNFGPTIIVIVGNLITLWFVYKDKKRFQIENKYLEILTFCFRPLGVCILLIQIIMKNNEGIDNEEFGIASDEITK